MATEVVTVRWCDRHLTDKDDYTPGEGWEVSVTAPGERPAAFAVEACPDCDGPLREVLGFLTAYGRKAGAAGQVKAPAPAKRRGVPRLEVLPGAEVLTCPQCDDYSTPIGDDVAGARSRMAGHGRRIHGVSLGTLLGEDTPYACPRCDQAFSRQHGLTLHLQKSHD